MLKKILNFSLILLTISVIGCGTDVKPTAFVDILKDRADADELSACLSELPAVSDEQITLKLDKQCLVDFSTPDPIDPALSPSFAEIIANPEAHMDRLLTFEAVVKKLHYNSNVELYTNNPDIKFIIHTHGAELYRLDAEGEEIPIQPNETYRFKCRIYSIDKNIDQGSRWNVNAEFIVSQSKKILHPPELVE